MIHPFLPDLSEKTLEELQETVNKLTGNLTFAHRMGNAAMIPQLTMVLEGYKTEISRRLDELYKKQNLKSQVNVSREN